MQTLKRQRLLIIGGSRGPGLGMVGAMVAHHGNITVIARDSTRLTEPMAKLGFRSFRAMPRIPSLPNPRFARCALRFLCSTRAPRRRWHRRTSRHGNRSVRTGIPTSGRRFIAFKPPSVFRSREGSRVLMSSSGAAIEQGRARRGRGRCCPARRSLTGRATFRDGKGSRTLGVDTASQRTSNRASEGCVQLFTRRNLRTGRFFRWRRNCGPQPRSN